MYSFYVAAYFAIESATTDAAIWAIRVIGLDAAVRTRLGNKVKPATVPGLLERNAGLAETILKSTECRPLVLHVEPFALNEQLSIQQGTFLFMADVRLSFVDNLAATFEVNPSVLVQPQGSPQPSLPDRDPFSKVHMLKILLPRDRHKSALDDLWNMNIHAGTLFPGMDGFARSLQHHLRMYDRDDEFLELIRS
jgi:hypothetical protein